ncbi:MAG: AMP-binding protein [Pseudomonadota bacterium]
MQFKTLEEAINHGMGPAWHAHHSPDRPALVLGDDTITHAQLNAQANQLAHALKAAGLVEGNSLAIISKNRLEFPISYFAAQRIGLRTTAINWHLTADEMLYILKDCEARVLVLDADLENIAQKLLPGAQDTNIKLSLGKAMQDFELFDAFIANAAQTDIEHPVAGKQMLYTSGTTGRPKGVIRPPKLATPNARRHYLPDHARVLCTGPLYHAAPFTQNMVQPLQQGKTVVIMPRFDAEETLRLIERHQITHSHMVATMFHRMLALPEDVRQKYDLSSLETIWHGAAPTPIPIKRAMIEWLGLKLDEYYASTETGGTEITAEEWLKKPGSVGLPEKGQRITVLDDDGNILPSGEIGTVYMDADLSGGFYYYGDEEKTKSVFRDNLYTLGDQGYLDEDGYLFLTGRTAEVIISGGVNIYPAEVDGVLLMHSAVQDAAVVGVPNEEFGEEVKAVVELKPETVASNELANELITFCREQLAHYKCPKTVDFVDRLPRSDAGKVFRKRVRDSYRQA